MSDQATAIENEPQRVPAEPARTRPYVTLHLLDDEGVLLDAAQQSVYALNTAGTFIWCCVEEGLSSDEIVARLQSSFGITPAAAADYLAAALEQWRDLRLVTDAPSEIETVPLLSAAGIATGREIGPSGSGRAPRPGPHEQDYLLLDVGFRLRILTPALRREIEPLLAPLATTSIRSDFVRLDLMENERGFVILEDGRPYAHCRHEDQVVPLVKTCLIEIALKKSGDFGAVHAAAVTRNNRCILLPGGSGAGKSTLTAALVAAGFELLGDDTTVLARGTLEARPVPFAICVKEGSWGLLASRFPELADLPTHHRLDGKRVRYLPPLRGCAWAKPRSRCRVDALVFLNRVPEAKSSLVRLTRAEALSRFSKEFCPLGEGLTPAKLSQLVTWIKRVDTFELRYSPLDDGVEQLADLCCR